MAIGLPIWTRVAEGLAVTALNSGNGTWQYSLDGGSTWNAVGGVSNNSALLLRASDRLRFVPNALTGTIANCTFRAWDQTSGAAGSKVDVSSNGGSSPFSTATATASISVTDVNDAPTVGLPSGSVSYVENVTYVLLDAAATVVDPDSADFAGGTLTVSLVTGYSEDRLGIRHQGNGAGQIGVSGNLVSYGGVAIGSFAGGGSGTSPLVISLNANANPVSTPRTDRKPDLLEHLRPAHHNGPHRAHGAHRR